MSRRTRQAHALAATLSSQVGQLIAVTWEGPRHRAGRRGGWRVAWHDGPNEDDMRSLVVAHATTEAPDLDPGALGYDHHRSDQGTAVALLTWLAAHPDGGDRLREVLHADRLPGASASAPARTHALAETLLAAGWTPADHDHGRVGARLEELAVSAGWEGVAGWLERLATSHDTTEFHPVVVDLDAHRARQGRRVVRVAESKPAD